MKEKIMRATLDERRGNSTWSVRLIYAVIIIISLLAEKGNELKSVFKQAVYICAN